MTVSNHRRSLAHLPTPVEPLPRLSALFGGPQLFIKRDAQTGLALGANKTRKLVFLVGKAQARDARILFWHTGGQPAPFAEPYQGALSQTTSTHGADAD